MLRYRSLPVLAVRRMLGNWRLLSSVVVGTLVAAAIISATAIYADAIRDLGLQFALEQRPESELDVLVTQSNVTVGSTAYQQSQARIDRTLAGSLGSASAGLIRQGTTSTFFATAPGEPVDRGDTNRPRSNIRFRSEVESHIELVDGVFPGTLARGGEGPVPVAIGAETAARAGLSVGDTLDLHPFWDEDAVPLQVQISGLVTVRDLGERYWAGVADPVDARLRSWETYLLYVPEATFFGVVQERIRTLSADYVNQYLVDFEGLNARNAVPVADQLSRIESSLSATETRARVQTGLVEVLRSFDQKLFFTRIPLFVLLLQIGGIVAYYLVMVSTMLVERQAAEIATLRSRGATTAQLLAQYGVEGGILALLAAVTGPPIAAVVISALGPTPAFDALSGGGTLDVHISRQSYLLAAGGALIAFTSLMIPAWRATRTTVVEFKRATARPRRTPLFLRYYLDVALVLVLALIFWRLSQQEDLFTESLFGETQADPFLLTTPAVFMVTVGIVFLRLFPPVLRGIAWVIGQTRSVAVLVGMRSLVRNPTHYTRLILLLMFATGVGMFGATFSATLDRSYEDRAGYVVGADVRAADLRPLTRSGDGAFVAAIEGVPAQAASPLVRIDGTIQTAERSEDVQFLGVDPQSLGEVAYFRDDFGGQPLDAMLETLAGNATSLEGVPLPEDARQLGVWLHLPDIRGNMSIAVTLRDRDGRYGHYLLAQARPDDGEVTEGWRFLAIDLQRPATRSGASWREPLLEAPLTLHGISISTNSRIAAQRGVMLIGPAMTTAAEPLPLEEGARLPVRALEAPFEGGEMLTDFTAPAFEVMQGLRPFTLEDQMRPDADAPPGFEQSVRYSWLDSRLSPQTRGLSQQTDGEPVLLYLSSGTAGRLGLAVGDQTVIALSSRYARAEVAGTLDLFPTTAEGRRADAFAIVDASRLIAAANASAPDRVLGYSEAWFASDDPQATREALAPFEPQTLMNIESELLLQQEDPLVAAGWAGILAISFGAVLLLSAIGFVVYSYLTAQQRGLEFAILRTLGFSRLQVFAVVLFEHLFVIAAGMGLGTLVGLQIGRYMMDFLATDERGLEVQPPFLLQVSWAEILLVWGILGTVFVVTIGGVVLLYFRLAVHRALRIGDV
ncbi:MAG: FtsX-like permease family protein [Dehalococcoidia bacterium]|nr:FtsX-like permease family protein [Dehalococcoidia bacterium]